MDKSANASNNRQALSQYVHQTLAKLDAGIDESQLKRRIMPQVVASIKRLSARAPAEVKKELKRLAFANAVLPYYKADVKAFRNALLEVLVAIGQPLAAVPGDEQIKQPQVPSKPPASAERAVGGTAAVKIMNMNGSIVLQLQPGVDVPVQTMQDQIYDAFSSTGKDDTLCVLDLCLNDVKLEASETLAAHGITDGQHVDIVVVQQHVQISGVYAAFGSWLLILKSDGRAGFTYRDECWAPPVVQSFRETFLPAEAAKVKVDHRQQVKDFNKAAKTLREILKLEEQSKTGELAPNQLVKLGKKHEFLDKLISLAPYLPAEHKVPDDISRCLPDVQRRADDDDDIRPCPDPDDWIPGATEMLKNFSARLSREQLWGQWNRTSQNDSCSQTTWMRTIVGNVTNAYCNDDPYYTFEAVAMCDSNGGHFLEINFHKLHANRDATINAHFYNTMNDADAMF